MSQTIVSDGDRSLQSNMAAPVTVKRCYIRAAPSGGQKE